MTNNDNVPPRGATTLVPMSSALHLVEDDGSERRRAGLRRLLERKNITATDLARTIGLPTPNALYNFLNGRTASLSLETVERILSAHPDVSFHDLVGLKAPAPGRRHRPSPGLLVTVELCSGVWRPQIELPAEAWCPAPLMSHGLSDDTPLFAARVRSPGAELLYPDGSVLLCRLLAVNSPLPPDGARVVVLRRRRSKVELTVRELRSAGGEVWLWPCSTDPQHQTPLQLGEASSDTSATDDVGPAVTLLGAVIASWQPEPTTRPK